MTGDIFRLFSPGARLAIILFAMMGQIRNLSVLSVGSLTARPIPTRPAGPGPSQSTVMRSLQVNAAAFKGMGRLAFVCGGLLYILDGQAGRVRQLTKEGVSSQPAWSHDGEWLAFMHEATPKAMSAVWLARFDGTQLRQVSNTDLGYRFSWSPAKNVLAVDGKNGLLLVPVNGVRRRLREGGLSWAPDGGSLAYSFTLPFDFNHPEGRTDALRTITVEGGQPVNRLTAPGGNGIVLAGWWPNGKGLLYWLDPDHSASLMADGVDLYSLRLGASEPELLASGLDRRGWLSTSSGNRLVMVKGGPRIVWANKSLALINLESGNVQDLENLAGCVTIDPSLSPDGSQIALVAARDLGDHVWGFNRTEDLTSWVATRTLWVENSDGSGAHPLTAAGRGIYQPQWSKNGKRILYVKDNSLWLIGIDGGEPEEICGPLSYEDPTTGPFGYYGFVSYLDEMAWYRH